MYHFHVLLVAFLCDVLPTTAFVSRQWALRLSVSTAKQTGMRTNPMTPGSVSSLSAMAIPLPGNSTTTSSISSRDPNQKRFDRSASTEAAADQDCILEIDGQRYNLTKWAKAHPGGVNVLQKFHDKDASKAFHAADHSTAAYAMLKDFWIGPVEGASTRVSSAAVTVPLAQEIQERNRPRWVQKLFTREDPIGIHKYMGIFVLAHFIFRFGQLYFGDPSAGFGTRLGKRAHVGPVLCLIPHAVLSLSSLIFHTGMCQHHDNVFVASLRMRLLSSSETFVDVDTPFLTKFCLF